MEIQLWICYIFCLTFFRKPRIVLSKPGLHSLVLLPMCTYINTNNFKFTHHITRWRIGIEASYSWWMRKAVCRFSIFELMESLKHIPSCLIKYIWYLIQCYLYLTVPFFSSTKKISKNVGKLWKSNEKWKQE